MHRPQGRGETFFSSALVFVVYTLCGVVYMSRSLNASQVSLY